MNNPMEYYAEATDALTGEPRYFGKADIPKDDYSAMKASCAIPFVCHPYSVGGRAYFDGALGDTIPIEKAFSLGCDRVVLLLTLPEDTVRTPDRDAKLARRIRKKYPAAAERLAGRAEHYNSGVALAKSLAAEGRLMIVAPDDTCGVSTLCRDPEALTRLYEKGYADGPKVSAFLGAGE